MESPESWFVVGIAIAVFVLILIPGIFYLITLQRTLEAVSVENRAMPPGQVWLLLIPVFNFVWHFIVTIKISDSIKNECGRLSIATSESRPTYSLGMSLCVLSIASYIPMIGTMITLVTLVVWILYWIKVNDYRKLILANQSNVLFDVERENPQQPSI